MFCFVCHSITNQDSLFSKCLPLATIPTLLAVDSSASGFFKQTWHLQMHVDILWSKYEYILIMS